RFLASKHPVPTTEAPAKAAVPAASDRSIAVLPFVDMSEKKDQEYFSDGLSEELINRLAHTPDLKVIARTSSFQFKGRNEDVRTIGQRLGVANLLEGSVRTSGKALRVTVQLIKVSDGSHLWSQTYDRDMRDIFAIQDAIATAVVTALQATLATRSPDRQSVSTEAYTALLRGRYFAQMRTKEDSERAIAAYREAIRLDPAYALAYAELAETYAWWSPGWRPSREAYTEARTTIDQSLRLDPNLALGHRVLGWIEAAFNYDFVEAEAARKRADELDPTDPLSTYDAAYRALLVGHLDEAIRLNRQLVERNPLDPAAWATLWQALIRANRLTEAEAAARTFLDLNPRAAFAHVPLGLVLLYQGKPNEALQEMGKETDEAMRLLFSSQVLWELGRRTEADELLAEAKAKYGDAAAFAIAGRHAIRNEKDEAFLWLDRAYERREPPVIEIRTDEAFRNLHKDPRWKAFLSKLKLPE
ncbi:MAG: tetratricopeptide repeat protein, partial [Gammaproteobacteria bacterium]|nr:tetratricopeptide repeat protein [Gammaproteobacteria bacterium]